MTAYENDVLIKYVKPYFVLFFRQINIIKQSAERIANICLTINMLEMRN